MKSSSSGLPLKNPRHCTHLSQANVALQIESLVQAIEHSDTPAFWITQDRSEPECIKATRLSRYFTHIKQMFDLFDDRVPYDYSEYLQAFWEACQDIGLERSSRGPVCLNEIGTAYLGYHHSMNVLVARIRELTLESWYLRRKWDRLESAKQQEREIVGYTDAVMSLYSRTTIIRVNLYYHNEAHAKLRVEHVFDDLDALIVKHSRHSTFEHLIGYAYSVEQGDRSCGRGYHIHAAYFFNGNLICGDVWKATEIGELWGDITHGRGYFHSCNHEKDLYQEELGIGCIHRDDEAMRAHLHKTMRYLVKGRQYLRLKPNRARRIRKGQLRSCLRERKIG